MKNNKRTIFLTMTALVLTLCIGVGSAMAYFTTYAIAKGGVEIDLGFTRTVPEETVVNGKKEITLKNTGDYDCYVRLKALTGDKYKDSIRYSEPENLDNWAPGEDGYYYYRNAEGDIIVAPKENTTQIDISFSFPTVEPDDFNVIIIQECTPVLYDADGNPYADWSVKADVSHSIYK